MQVEAYIGEIRMWGGTFAPEGWLKCDGTILHINEFGPLFALIGNYYGGDGRVTFQLPDLRGRVPINFGRGPGLTNYSEVGIAIGAEETTLATPNLPPASIAIPAYDEDATISTPAPQLCLAKSRASTATQHLIEVYSDQTPNTTIKGGTLPGSNFPINIRQPLLSVCFIIATEGIFPVRP